MYSYLHAPGWQQRSLYDLASWRNGLAFKSADFSKYGKPIIKIAELKGGVSEQTARSDAAYDPSVHVTAGDMLFSWSGNPDTSIDVFRWNGEDGWLNQHIFRVMPATDVLADYLFLLLRSLRPQFAEIARNKQTTGLGHVTVRDLKDIQISLPPMTEQTAIAAVLMPLEAKIELNRRMNEALEASARALFRDWFVDFGPTRGKAEGRPAYLAPDLWSLFPDCLGDDDVPEGWKTESLLDQAHWVNGAAYKNMHFVDRQAGLPVVKIAELKAGVTAQTKFTNTDLGDRYRIANGDLFFSWSGNPDTSIDAFLWTGGPAWLNQHIFAVRENGKRSKAELFVLLKWLMPEFAEIARNKQTTGLGHVTKDDMKRLQVIMPSVDIQTAFTDCVAPMFDQILSNIAETFSLAATRDALLPKLMSGELRVRDAEALTA